MEGGKKQTNKQTNKQTKRKKKKENPFLRHAVQNLKLQAYRYAYSSYIPWTIQTRAVAGSQSIL
jgi:hypothetical protein